ncbi:alpha/beta hydrolase family protein [Saccharothrix algeriensis]|uniref:Pimeloyl-ACP methyl ester carboxylesterase n=1 Tax=Saccharothrix algeriensis TaxID=173560 RepID=A0A8T8HUY2_9PSEU|nr:hypothetical protein [Saccharothrix algeriensis]MBM7813741.1 pimeloyl-ACP methyl ester carboxylesterase [Saccharothrix algeriensis]QTR02201.1 hypothetical protein J7S33_23830 [Saccharothrix algeriensis]
MRRVLGSVFALILLFALPVAAAPVAPPAPPSAAEPGGTPPDRPLPGYAISNPPLAPALVGGEPSRVEQGVHRHAAYTAEVPPRWNGRLALWAHGYRGPSATLTVEPPPHGLRQRLLDQGFAWAASSYSANGYDVKAGVESTRDLAGHFAALVGQPRDVFLVGASMGGHVIARSLEQHPGSYRGALALCGALGDHELFDFFLDHQLVAQALAGVDAFPLPADYLSTRVPLIKANLGLDGTPNERGRQFARVVVERSGGERPGAQAAFAHWRDFLFGLPAVRTGDDLATDPLRIATNASTRYAPTTPVDLNREVERVPPQDPRARQTPELTAIPRVEGRPSAPVLSLHGLGDLFVPFSMEQRYQREVRDNGRSDLLAQRAIRTVEHCEFSPAEVGRAWDDLVAWADTGRRPAADVVDDPAAVAAADYGCRFSDPDAYGTGTRGSFPRC